MKYIIGIRITYKKVWNEHFQYYAVMLSDMNACMLDLGNIWLISQVVLSLCITIKVTGIEGKSSK